MKTIYIILCYLSITLVGCTYEEADIFADSPAERMNKALKDNNDSLQSAVNGWAMEYFAHNQSAGYTLLVKFDKSGQAIIAGKSELTKNIIVSDSSMYEIIGDNGPVLTFNMFNSVLHTFSNPVNPDGYGLEGDYEFIVMKTTANQIVLKGKKRGTTILLNKIPENVSWTQYFANVDAMNSLLFGNNAPQLTMNLTHKYGFSNGSTHIFNILKNEADANTSVNAPFIVTPTGIRFHSAQVLDSLSFQTFTLNDDKSALQSVENSNVKLIGPDSLAAYFVSSLNTWAIDPLKLSTSIKPTYDLLVQSLVKKYNATAIKLTIKYSASRKYQVLMISFTSGKTKIDGMLDLALSVEGKDNLTMTYLGTGDKNGINFYSNIPGYKEMAVIISSSYNVVTDISINPKNIKFTQKQDADQWFTATVE